MKLALRQEENCSVLEIQGSVDAKNFAVLKAGLTKLFQNGKNKIVLHLVSSPNDLSADVIRELAILDVFARELSGKIVIASESAELKSKVSTFAKPPIVAILPSVAKAIEYMKDLSALEGDEGGESAAELATQLEARAQQVAALEAQIKQADPSALNTLRAENAELKDKVKLLEGQIADILGKRRQPETVEGFFEKIEALEESLKKMGGEKVAAAGAKK